MRIEKRKKFEKNARTGLSSNTKKAITKKYNIYIIKRYCYFVTKWYKVNHYNNIVNDLCIKNLLYNNAIFMFFFRVNNLCDLQIWIDYTENR